MINKFKLLITTSILILFLFLNYLSFQDMTQVFNDRSRWEKTGKIIWEVKTSKKIVALTFDDGPSPTFTPQILDVLKQYNAKATFFVIGKQAEKFPEVLKTVALQGHTIGNHMYNHQLISKLTLQKLVDDLKHSHHVINKLTGIDPHFFRPPDGYYDEKIVKAAESLNYQIIIWTWGQDSRDWTMVDGAVIAKNVIKNTKPGDIILFHDLGGDRTNTVEALKIILPELTKKGYTFVTLDDLIKNK